MIKGDTSNNVRTVRNARKREEISTRRSYEESDSNVNNMKIMTAKESSGLDNGIQAKEQRTTEAQVREDRDDKAEK